MKTEINNAEYRLADGVLRVNNVPLLAGIPEAVTLVEDPGGVGVFLRCVSEKPLARLTWLLGDLQGVQRLTFAHRYEPFWMTAKAGTKGGDVLPETQFLLCEREDASVALFAPILDGDFRACLQGTGENGLELVAESGDPSVCAAEVTGLFIAAHADVYTLMGEAAESVMARMQTGKLRRDKPLPAFADQFGWCTWDAFYQDVSHDKVREGLESFARGGITPKLLILDDGWQSQRKRPSGEQRLTAFAANEKFPGELAPTVRMAKEEFGVETFVVWHALNGYWGGVDEETLPGYEVRAVPRRFSPGILHHRPTIDSWWGGIVGTVSGQAIYRFYQDYHRHLRRQGVDGVKVDTQCTIEGVAVGEGGRVKLMRNYHEALEGSTQTHFGGNLINCMSCSSEMLYSALNSTLTRTSTDFWPDKPESHGEHLYVNALVSLWFGQFVHPDWDMFQSGHAMGEYHAMARAVSGAPVYVSDKPGAHNFDVLRKLVLPNGSILRAPRPGCPTRDCLFHDPTREDALLKIFNYNNIESGVIGVFNARYEQPGETTSGAEGEADAATVPLAANAAVGAANAEAQAITGHVSPADIPLLHLHSDRFIVYRHTTGECRVMGLDERWEIRLPALTGDVFTVVPLVNGFAPIGLADMYNSGGASDGHTFLFETVGARLSRKVWIRGGGRFLAWSETRPTQVILDKKPVAFSYTESSRLLELVLPQQGRLDLTIEWEAPENSSADV